MHIVVGRLACFDVVFPCQVGVFGVMECMRQVLVVCGRRERSVCAVSGRMCKRQWVSGSGIGDWHMRVCKCLCKMAL